MHNVHDTHPHLSPADTWKSLFTGEADSSVDPDSFSPFFTPSKTPSHLEILRILKENPVDTVSILAVGPLTNVALAAAEDPETFLRVKELVVMGGAVNVVGNVTPVAEFNTYADAIAAARVYALTSKTPNFTLPKIPERFTHLSEYPENLSRQLKLTLCPLDITTPHFINKSFFVEKIKPIIDSGSPLALWTSHFIMGAYKKIEEIVGDGSDAELSLHDPLTVWYMLTQDDPKWKTLAKPEDIRVETSGQWTLGMHVVDNRGHSSGGEVSVEVPLEPEGDAIIVLTDDVPGDTMGWFSARKGNNIRRLIASPGEEIFKEVWMQRVFG